MTTQDQTPEADAPRRGRPHLDDRDRRTAITVTIDARMFRAITRLVEKTGASRSRVVDTILAHGIRPYVEDMKRGVPSELPE